MFAGRFSKIAMASALMGTLVLPPSMLQASVVDSVFFRILGLVIVWGANDAGTSAPYLGDFVLMTTGSGNAGADLISTDVRPVLTGTLTPVPTAAAGQGTVMSFTGTGAGSTDSNADGFLDATDSLSEFLIDDTTGVQASNVLEHSFYVASNTAFNINATVGTLSTTDDFSGVTTGDIGWSMSMTNSGTDGGVAFGGSAAAGAIGAFGAQTDLADVQATPTVFSGTDATAAAAGDLVDQSVRFNTQYSFASYDLSQGTGEVAVDVTYTIFVP